MVLWWPLTIRNKGCSVASRFSDEVVLVMVESGAKSKNEQSVINSWSRCDIDTCCFSLGLITYSRTARVSVGTPLFYKSCVWWVLWEIWDALLRTSWIVDMFDFLSKHICARWDDKILFVAMIRVINPEMV